jgi:hypothetical protein
MCLGYQNVPAQSNTSNLFWLICFRNFLLKICRSENGYQFNYSVLRLAFSLNGSFVSRAASRQFPASSLRTYESSRPAGSCRWFFLFPFFVLRSPPSSLLPTHGAATNNEKSEQHPNVAVDAAPVHTAWVVAEFTSGATFAGGRGAVRWRRRR